MVQQPVPSLTNPLGSKEAGKGPSSTIGLHVGNSFVNAVCCVSFITLGVFNTPSLLQEIFLQPKVNKQTKKDSQVTLRENGQHWPWKKVVFKFLVRRNIINIVKRIGHIPIHPLREGKVPPSSRAALSSLRRTGVIHFPSVPSAQRHVTLTGVSSLYLKSGMYISGWL